MRVVFPFNSFEISVVLPENACPGLVPSRLGRPGAPSVVLLADRAGGNVKGDVPGIVDVARAVLDGRPGER